MTSAATTPQAMEGASFGPIDVQITAGDVAFYVDATGDDTDCWLDEAPPGFASKLLFAVADDFLYDEAIRPFTRTLLHLDQSFTYPRPMRVETVVRVEGTVTRVRERSGSYFVTFEASASDDGGVVIESRSTFVLSNAQAPSSPSPRDEPAVHTRGENAGALRSASRHDLVRYAAATRDFNPLHWDHAVALDAGLPGMVVHGLLMHAWLLQEVATVAEGAMITSSKVRFRAALHPGDQATLTAEAADGIVTFGLACAQEQLITGSATVGAPTE